MFFMDPMVGLGIIITSTKMMFICVIRILHREIKERLKCVDGLQKYWREGRSQRDKFMLNYREGLDLQLELSAKCPPHLCCVQHLPRESHWAPPAL